MTTEEAILALQQQVATLQAAAAAASAASTAQVTPLPYFLKAPKVAPFSGERGVDGQDVEVWAFGADNFFNLSPPTSDQQRIAYAVTRLEKTALQWWLYQTQLAARGGPALPTTWRQWVAALITRFQPINAERVARDRLSSITQTGSVGAYAAAFQKLLMRVTDLPDTQVLHFFLHGLQPAVKRQLLFNPPTSLSAAINDAERAASVLAITQPHSGNTGRFAAAPGRSGPTPMEIGAAYDEEDDACLEDGDLVAALRTPPPRRSASAAKESFSSSAGSPATKLTAEQRRYCMEHGLCLRCRKSGHLAATCPTYTASGPKGGRPPRAGAAALEQL